MSFDLSETLDILTRTPAVVGTLLRGTSTSWHQINEGPGNWHLTEAQLDLPGRHPELGSVNLRQLLATWAVHDLNHIAQIARVLAKRYTEEVGVWRAYISILNR